MANTVPIPQGATLVPLQSASVPIPQGAKLVPLAAPQTLDPSQPGMQPSVEHFDPAQSLGDFAKEWWNQVNPVTGITGMRDLTNHPVTTGGAMLDSQAAILDKAKQAFKNGRPVEGVRHALNYLIPVLGPQIDRAGDLADQGQFAKSAGATTGIATNIVAPELIKSLPTAALTAKAAPVAEKMYQSALKPSIAANSPAEIKSMVRTGLDNAIPISEAGSQKLAGLISDLNDKVQAKISAGAKSGATIDPKAVATRADQARARFTNQVNPTADLNAIDASKQEFLDNQHIPRPGASGPSPSGIPVDQAQTLKQGTYQQLKARAYGELGSATVEAQKSLARGIKEELEAQFPEIKGLNAEQGKAIGLDAALDKAVQRINNKDILGIGTPITSLSAAAGGAMIGGLKGAGAAAVSGVIVKMVLDNPAVKSEIAIAIDRATKGRPLSALTGRARVAAYTNALGNALSQSSASGSSGGSQQPTQ